MARTSHLIVIGGCALIAIGAALAQEGQGSYFPQLPPSKPCEAADITGIWKLQRLYEKPAGLESAGYAASPFQYLYFDGNGIYNDHKSLAEEEMLNVQTALKQQQAGKLRQFAVQSGIVFFYENAVAVDSMACFIVANPLDAFVVGQMLLMPPVAADGTIPSTRLVRIYDKTTPVKKRPRGRSRGNLRQR